MLSVQKMPHDQDILQVLQKGRKYVSVKQEELPEHCIQSAIDEQKGLLDKMRSLAGELETWQITNITTHMNKLKHAHDAVVKERDELTQQLALVKVQLTGEKTKNGQYQALFFQIAELIKMPESKSGTNNGASG